MKRFLKSSLTLVLAAVACSTYGQSAAGDMNAVFARLFGAVTAFTATTEIQVVDPAQQELLRMPMNLMFLDGKIRLDTDLMQMQSKDMPAAGQETFKQLGMDRITSVTRPDKKLRYIIYPGAQSYFSTPTTKEEDPATVRALKVERTALGNETVNGHRSVKNRVFIKDSKGAVLLEATTWNAPDLKDFPVQIMTKDRSNTAYVRFSDVKFVKPEARQFDPPSGFKEYSNLNELTAAASQKILRGGSPQR